MSNHTKCFIGCSLKENCKCKNDAEKENCDNAMIFYKANKKQKNQMNDENNIYEAIKIIEHYKFDFCLGNAIKYILRAGKKDESKYLEDLEKSQWYLNRKIESLKKIKNEK